MPLRSSQTKMLNDQNSTYPEGGVVPVADVVHRAHRIHRAWFGRRPNSHGRHPARRDRWPCRYLRLPRELRRIRGRPTSVMVRRVRTRTVRTDPTRAACLLPLTWRHGRPAVPRQLSPSFPSLTVRVPSPAPALRLRSVSSGAGAPTSPASLGLPTAAPSRRGSLRLLGLVATTPNPATTLVVRRRPGTTPASTCAPSSSRGAPTSAQSEYWDVQAGGLASSAVVEPRR